MYQYYQNYYQYYKKRIKNHSLRKKCPNTDISGSYFPIFELNMDI